MIARVPATLLVISLCVGCAGTTGPPRLPGSLVATHLGVGEPDGVVSLATETVPHGVGVRVVEDHADLEDLWREGRLRAPLPNVDFATRVVVTFDQDAFCNDARLTALAITSSGEIVPETQRSDSICLEMAVFRSLWRLYVMSLPRRALPAGRYVVRHGSRSSSPVTVTGGAPGPVLAPGPAEPLVTPPARPIPPGAHSRRARVLPRERQPDQGPADESAGVWVRDDAVWFASPSPLDEEAGKDLLACDEHACVRGLVRVRCEAPECPAAGTLLIAERPLRARGPWPTGESAWSHLMAEMAKDPVLAEILRQPIVEPDHRLVLVSYPHPPARPFGWLKPPFTHFAFEQSVGGGAGVFVGDGAAVGGIDARLGMRLAPYAGTTSGWENDLRDTAIGDNWGLDLRGRVLWELGATGAARRWATVGIAVAADNALGESNGKSHVRIPSLLGLVLPEMGVMVSTDAALSFYTAHGFPVVVLIAERFALEARPAFTLRFASGREPGPDAVVSLSVSVMHR